MITTQQWLHTVPEALHVALDLAINGLEDRRRRNLRLLPVSPAGKRRAFGPAVGSAIDPAFNIHDFLEPVSLYDLRPALVDIHVMSSDQAGGLVDAIILTARKMDGFERIDSSALIRQFVYRALRSFTLLDLAKAGGLLNGHEFKRFTYIDLEAERVMEGDILVWFPTLLISNPSLEYEELMNRLVAWATKRRFPKNHVSMGSMTSLLSLALINSTFDGPQIIPDDGIWLASTTPLEPLPLPGQLGGRRFMKLTYLKKSTETPKPGWWAGWANRASSESRYGWSGATAVMHFKAPTIE